MNLLLPPSSEKQEPTRYANKNAHYSYNGFRKMLPGFYDAAIYTYTRAAFIKPLLVELTLQ